MKHYIKIDEYETIQLDNEWIIMNTDQFTVTKLNAIGGYCWSLLESPHTPNELAQNVKIKFELDNIDLPNHIEDFLQELMKCDLVKHAV